MYAADTIAETARLILSNTAASPASLLAQAREDSPQLVGALTDFFHTHGHLAPPPGLAEQRAATRRKRRIDAVPALLRPDVRGFADFLLIQRERARQLGLRPNRLKTIEIRLDAVRDLAISLYAQGITSWTSVTTAHVEAFLATNPARCASRLAGLRQFFAHAHRTKAVLINPTAPVTAVQHRGFRGPTLTLPEQQSLYRRWTTNPDTHPHERSSGVVTLFGWVGPDGVSRHGPVGLGACCSGR
ncbi:hypothetical protein H8R17_44175, partial [Streptomyces sp. TRM68367]|nr:hypothetical protein [Streptomyces sp. TRM68367]